MVYVISDIHGALEEFQKLLIKTGFRYDGSDTLYLLGDYVDWGTDSIRTLLYVMHLERRYPFVHALMGNHEQMFLEAILSGYHYGDGNPAARNWIFRNHGEQTWEQYCELPESFQRKIALWLSGLPYSFSVSAGGKNYLLGHAYPYFDDILYSPREKLRHRYDAVWRRLQLREDPFAEYTGRRQYDMFVCGHTVTDWYFQEQRLRTPWYSRNPVPVVRNRIFYGEKFIDIDCGAKCFEFEGTPGSPLAMLAFRAQLAALRLDDGKEFYVWKVPVKTIVEDRILELEW